MSKGSGDTRGANYSLSRNSAYGKYLNNIESYGGDVKLSYFSEEGKGHLVWLKGHGNQKSIEEIKHNPEYKVAVILADNGYEVILTPEGNQYRLAISRAKNKKGEPNFVEGTISAVTYEQHTPTKAADSAYRSLKHAHDKNAEIALIYDENHAYHREAIAKGIHEYLTDKTIVNRTSFKSIITVNADKEIHFWDLIDDYEIKYKK